MRSQTTRGILFDMDGVLYNSETPIPGAAETITWVRGQSIPYLFVTNTSSRSRAVLVEKLQRFGIEAAKEQILTPCVAAAHWLRGQPAGPVALFVPKGAREEFDGLPQVPAEAENGALYVIIGDLADAWDYRTLNRAFRLLHHNAEARLLALGMTRYWQTEEGMCLDVAPFVAALEHATGRAPVVLGKPSCEFFYAAAEELGLAPSQLVMVGDDISTDVGGAQAAGMCGVLVRTGKFRPNDLEGPVKPDGVLASIQELPKWWEDGSRDQPG